MLTKKNFKRVAELIRTSTSDKEDRIRFVKVWIEFFQEENPRFRPEQFVQACGLELEDVDL